MFGLCRIRLGPPTSPANTLADLVNASIGLRATLGHQLDGRLEADLKPSTMISRKIGVDASSMSVASGRREVEHLGCERER
jgi:hypothetical protein